MTILLYPQELKREILAPALKLSSRPEESWAFGPPKVMKNGSCSATTVDGGTGLPFVISTEVQRSGGTCGSFPGTHTPSSGRAQMLCNELGLTAAEKLFSGRARLQPCRNSIEIGWALAPEGRLFSISLRYPMERTVPQRLKAAWHMAKLWYG